MIVFSVLSFIGFITLSSFLSYFQQGANPASIFNGNELIIPEPEQARWIPDAESVVYVPSTAQREELLSQYWSAWEAVNRAHLIGNITDLSTYWALPALEQVQQSINPERPIQQTTSGHLLQLTFFSDDFSVASFNDSFTLTQTLNGETRNLTVNATITLTLDTGFWRIRLMSVQYIPNT